MDPAEGLVIRVLRPGLHYPFTAEVFQLLEEHQSDGNPPISRGSEK